jgi:mRNA interferase RelE/StbE
MQTWKLLTSTTFDKQLDKMDRSSRSKIVAYLENRVLTRDNPKTLAKPLMGDFAGLWRFRVGDFRVIADIQDDTLIIIALEIGHRREIYH